MPGHEEDRGGPHQPLGLLTLPASGTQFVGFCGSHRKQAAMVSPRSNSGRQGVSLYGQGRRTFLRTSFDGKI